MAEQNATNTAITAIGEVQAVTGRVIAIGADGIERQLFAGDPVYADDQIKTVGQSTIVVALKDGTRFDLGRDSEAVLDETVYSDDVAAVKEAALADIEEIQRMILEGADPTEITEEPAAGGDQSSAGESLQEAVGLDRTGRVGVVEAGYETRGLEQSIDLSCTGVTGSGFVDWQSNTRYHDVILDRTLTDDKGVEALLSIGKVVLGTAGSGITISRTIDRLAVGNVRNLECRSS